MTKAKAKPAKDSPVLAQTVTLRPGQTPEQYMADMTIGTTARSAFLHYVLCGKLFGAHDGVPDQRAPFEVMQAELAARQEAAASGDLRAASDLLITQAHVLDAVFGDFMHRGLENASRLDVVQRYMGLALKAQSQSRAAIEALARMHQPREQVVRHVHVYEGGQAVVADELHMHANRGNITNGADQPHTPSPAGPTLLGADTGGDVMPMPGGEGKEAVPAPRRRRR